ncbi:MAG: hypothetical protein IT480_13980 [Gammaproteobacteria bacterium]|nr:hypothetical protein [Gammaproteobacteria bacterium]
MKNVVVLFDQPEGQDLVRSHCRRIRLPVADLRRLVEEVVSANPMQRRHGLWHAFDEVLDQTAENGAA